MGVAVVIAIDLASASAEHAFVASAEIFLGKVTHKIENSKQKIDEQQYATLKRNFPQLQIAPVIERSVKKVTEEDPSLFSEYFRIFAVDPFSETGFRDFSGVDTTDNQNSLLSLLSTPNSVLVSEQTADKHGLKKDSTFLIDINGKHKRLVVIGIISTDKNNQITALDDVLLMDISVAQDVLDTAGFLSRIDVSSHNAKLLAQVIATLPLGYHVIELDNPSNALSQMTLAFRTNLQAMSLLAVMVGMFLIYNTMTFSVMQRRDTFATLRAIGVTHREIFSVVFFEALLIGLIGTVLGLIIGMLLGKGLLVLVVRTINDLYFDLNLSQLSISPLSLIKGLFLGIIATLVSAWIPLREAFKTSPRENLNRSQLEIRKKTITPKLAIVGGILIFLGVGFIFVVNQSLLLSFFFLFLVFTGYALVVPMMVIKVVGFIRPLAAKYLGNIAAMSLGNITNSLSRTGVAMTALTLAVATTVGVTTMVGSFRYAVQDWLEDSLKEDIYLALPSSVVDDTMGQIKSEMTSLLESHIDVEDISIRLWTKVRSELGESSILVQQIPEYGFKKYEFLSDTHLATFDHYQNQDSIMISEPLANKNQLIVGNTLKLLTDKGEKDFQIIGIYRDYSSDQGVITLSRKAYSRYWVDPGISSYGVYLKPTILPDDFIDKLEREIQLKQLNKSGPIQIVSNDNVLEKSLNVFDQTFAITNVLRILTIIVAFIGILSAFMALQLERGREFATLRAIGLTPQQLWRSMLLEMAVMGCIAGILAIPLGLILSVILIMVINVESFGWSMAISVNGPDLLFAVLFSIVAALLAGMYPAYKMSKQVPAKLLSSE